MEKENLIQLHSITVCYGGVKALDNVNVSLDEGDIVVLMGHNGAGKSTILKTIFGMVPINSGRVFWQGKEIKPVTYEAAQRGISFVPQGRRVFNHLTVEENLEVGGIIINNKNTLKAHITEVMETFPILKYKRRAKAGTLSGGQQQILALARGLIIKPRILLLDEPSLGLAPKIVEEVYAKVSEINKKHKTAILIVEHNIKPLLNIATRGYVLDKGKVIAGTTSQKLLKSGILERVFIGRNV